MKKTILSVLIANTLAVSTAAYAADDRGFIDESMMFGGHVGTSFEYEDKETTNNKDNIREIERTKTNEVFSAFYKNSAWDVSALYSLKIANRKKRNENHGYWENEDSTKHLVLLQKNFNLSNGWSTGLMYDLEYIDGKLYSDNVHGLKKTSAEHEVKPYLNYANSSYDYGIESYFSYLYMDKDESAYGSREEEGYSILIKPYKTFGNLELGIEFFYQNKENTAKSPYGPDLLSDFYELYAEPVVTYSFEDAGVLYVRARFGKNETEFTKGNQWAGSRTGDKYFKDIRKATVGYEQAVGDDWLLKAEYEYANEVEDNNVTTKEKDLKQHTIFAQAVYRL